MELILLGLFIVSMLTNMLQGAILMQLKNNPIEKVVYQEIEVVKRAVCECGHESSKHNGRGCQQQMFKLDGQLTKNSYVCFCTKYVGPEPLSEYFDDMARQLESKKYKELES